MFLLPDDEPERVMFIPADIKHRSLAGRLFHSSNGIEGQRGPEQGDAWVRIGVAAVAGSIVLAFLYGMLSR